MTSAPLPTAPTSPPITVTSTLQAIWNDEGMNIVWAALIAWWPPLAGIFAIPVIGGILKSLASYVADNFIDGLIAQGVIVIKIGILDYLTAEAQAKWASQIAILKQVQGEGETLTPEQQAAYDAALQELGENHPGVVNA